MSSVAAVKFIKTKVIFRYHTKGVSTKFHQIQITKSKFQYQNEKNEEVGKIFWVTKPCNKVITNWGRF